MKRLLALVGTGFLGALAAASFCGREVAALLGGGCLLAGLVSCFFPKLRQTKVAPVVGLICAVGFLVYAAADFYVAVPLEKRDGQQVQITGTVWELPERENDRWQYVLRVKRVVSEDGSEQETDFSVRATAYDGLCAQAGDTVTATVTLYAPLRETGFSTRAAYAAKGIHLFAYVDAFAPVTVHKAEKQDLHGWVLQIRSKILAQARRILPGEAGELLCAVGFGDKSGLTEECNDTFRALGVSHLLVVSGIHMTTVAGLAYLLFCFGKKSCRWYGALPVCAVLIFYMAVVGFTPSVVRSAVMCILLVLSSVFGREYDPPSAMGAAALAVSVGNPFAGGSVGLILSFAAVWGILLLTPVLRRLLRRTKQKVVRYIGASLLVSVAAGVFTVPVQILAFGSFSVLAPFATLLLLPGAALLLQSGLLAVALSFLPVSGISLPFTFVSGACAQYVRYTAEGLKKLFAHSTVYVHGYGVPVMLGCMLLVAALLWTMRKPGSFVRVRKACCVGCALLVLTGAVTDSFVHRESVKITLLAKENGGVVMTDSGEASVLCFGDTDAYGLQQILQAQGITRVRFVHVTTDAARQLTALYRGLRGADVEQLCYAKRLVVPGLLTEQAQYAAAYSSAQTVTGPHTVCTLSAAGVRVEVYGHTVWVPLQPGTAGAEYVLATEETLLTQAAYAGVCVPHDAQNVKVSVPVTHILPTGGETMTLEFFANGKVSVIRGAAF